MGYREKLRHQVACPFDRAGYQLWEMRYIGQKIYVVTLGFLFSSVHVYYVAYSLECIKGNSQRQDQM